MAQRFGKLIPSQAGDFSAIWSDSIVTENWKPICAQAHIGFDPINAQGNRRLEGLKGVLGVPGTDPPMTDDQHSPTSAGQTST